MRSNAVDDWLTPEQVAEELHMHIETVREWIRLKHLPAYQLGRVYRVKREDLERFLEQRRTTGEQPKR